MPSYPLFVYDKSAYTYASPRWLDLEVCFFREILAILFPGQQS